MEKTHIHFVGIKGVGMTALAILLKEKGFYITGSDVAEEFVTQLMLQKFKIPLKVGFNHKDLKHKPDLAIVTGAHGGKTNPEAIVLATEGIEVITHGEAVGRFMKGFFGISVAGVGGKTTTSAMLAHLLTSVQLDPSYVVGAGAIMPLGKPGHAGHGKYFVAEADEYVSCPKTDITPRMLYQHPQVIVITNIEYDHPDMYKSLDETLAVFELFISQLPEDGFVVINTDSSNNRTIIKKLRQKKIITYGFSADADYKISSVSFTPGITKFILKHNDLAIGEFILLVPGKFNALNATAAIVVGLQLGLSVAKIQEGLVSFRGTKRRFELIADKNKIRLYDDYAHHPQEIAATLLACREWFKKEKIVVIFQPHTYSRTKALLKQFSQSFELADEVLILPIFSSAREKDDPEINSEILVAEIGRYQPHVKFMTDNKNLLSYLSSHLDRGSIVLTMGAGDVYKLHKDIKRMM